MSIDPALLQLQVDKLNRDLVQARKDIDTLTCSLRETRDVIRPGVDELKRRAVAEAEVMETMSHQRHRIDKWETRLASISYIVDLLQKDPMWPWRTKLWRLIERRLTNPTLRRWVGSKLLG